MTPLATAGPQSYASTSMGTTGPNHHDKLVDLNNFFLTESLSRPKRNQKGNHRGTAAANDSHVFCTSNHEMSVKNIDLFSVKNTDINDIMSRSAIQPQSGDASQQFPEYDNLEYVTNMTNMCKNIDNQLRHDYFTEWAIL